MAGRTVGWDNSDLGRRDMEILSAVAVSLRRTLGEKPEPLPKDRDSLVRVVVLLRGSARKSIEGGALSRKDFWSTALPDAFNGISVPRRKAPGAGPNGRHA
jgi:hypothetical protein